MVFCTVVIFFQVALATVKIIGIEMNSLLSYIAKSFILILIYSSFFVLIYVTVEDGLDESKPIIFGFTILCVVASLHLIVTFGQEASGFLLSEENTEDVGFMEVPKVQNISNILKDMSTTIEFAKILCVVFMYLQFRAEIFLQEDPNAFLSQFSYLSAIIELSTAAILVQMLAQIGEFFVGLNPYLSFVVGLCYFLCVVGLLGSVLAATAQTD